MKESKKSLSIEGIGKIHFKILNPGGNKTALVYGGDFNKDQKGIINDAIMKEYSDVEQVGFLSDKEKRLDMAGGEFCLNASRCAIYEFSNNNEVVGLSVSGINKLITGKRLKSNLVELSFDISKNKKELICMQDKYWRVNIEGILIVVVDEENSKEYIKKLKEDETIAKEEIKELMINDFKTNEKAIGMMLLERLQNKIKINPVVWVKDIDTVFYETACGSGSLGTAIYNYYRTKEKSVEIIQPSGYSIKIELDANDGYINKAIISGIVEEE